MGLMLSISSCASNDTKAIYIIPDIYFPPYPSPEGQTIPLDENMDKVTDNNAEIKYVAVTLDYYRQIVTYKLDVDKAKIKYTTFREAIEK